MKKNKEIVIILILTILVAAIILPRNLNNLDEIWNYNFGINIANGKLPYKDFNMVQTPLSAMISGMILKVFGNELIVMRTLGIILSVAILYVTYKILEKLKVNRYVIYISLALIFLLNSQYFTYDYNYLILLITLITIYFELEKEVISFNIKKELLLGILVGTSILAKQTTGIILSLVFIFYKILIAKNKEEWKSVVKIIFTRIVGISIPVILFLIYLFKNNIMNEFLDYAIYGIKQFSNYIPYTNLFKYYGTHITILAITIPITILYMYYKAVVKENKGTMLVLFSYSCASFTAVYPISDNIHFIIAALPTIIGLIYILYNLFKEKIKTKIVKEILKAIINIAIISAVITSIVILAEYIISCGKYKSLNHFKYIPVRS